MAIIDCPSCKNRISDKAKVCSHCNFNLVSSTSSEGLTPEQLASKANLARIKLRYSLQMQAMSGIILFLLGFMLWYFVGNRGMSEFSHFLEFGLIFLGGIWYLITRIRLIAFKKSN
jgi:hypothetical protein